MGSASIVPTGGPRTHGPVHGTRARFVILSAEAGVTLPAVSMPSESVRANCQVNPSVSRDGDDHDDGERAAPSDGPDQDPARRAVDGRRSESAGALRTPTLAPAERLRPVRSGRPRPWQPGPTLGPPDRARPAGPDRRVAAGLWRGQRQPLHRAARRTRGDRDRAGKPAGDPARRGHPESAPTALAAVPQSASPDGRRGHPPPARRQSPPLARGSRPRAHPGRRDR